MIQSFRCKDSLALYDGKNPRKLRAFVAIAERKLAQLDAAQTLAFLRTPPGDRKGQHSIRVNEQWRICFVWTDVGPKDVEIVDYH